MIEAILLEEEKQRSEAFILSCILYEEAKENIVHLNYLKEPFWLIRYYLNNEKFDSLNVCHDAKLHWIVDEWEQHFLTTGKRFSDEV